MVYVLFSLSDEDKDSRSRSGESDALLSLSSGDLDEADAFDSIICDQAASSSYQPLQRG